MNETLKVIKNRRSFRQYKADQITDSELQAVLESALYAPNAMNQQKWHFTVVQDKVMLDRMVTVIKENIMNSGNEFLMQRASTPNYNTFYHAPTVILISGDEQARMIQIDCGAAAENLCLAAESLNIASCLMTSPGLLFASEKGNALKKELGIPDGYTHVCTVALGYKPAENPAAPTRNRDVINYVR